MLTRESHFRDPTVKGHLAAFEPRFDATAASGLLPLLPTATGLTEGTTLAATDTFSLFRRPFWGFEVA